MRVLPPLFPEMVELRQSWTLAWASSSLACNLILVLSLFSSHSFRYSSYPLLTLEHCKYEYLRFAHPDLTTSNTTTSPIVAIANPVAVAVAIPTSWPRMVEPQTATTTMPARNHKYRTHRQPMATAPSTRDNLNTRRPPKPSSSSHHPITGRTTRMVQAR